MKCVLEFGIRGGFHTENVILPTLKLGEQLASRIVGSFTNSWDGPARRQYWTMSQGENRIVWQSETHFVALSKLNNPFRGPASAKLWKK